MTKQQAINTIQNIMECQGYKETDGDNWLGPRLMDLYDYIRGIESPSADEHAFLSAVFPNNI